jgi:hypothetical protein
MPEKKKAPAKVKRTFKRPAKKTATKRPAPMKKAPEKPVTPPVKDAPAQEIVEMIALKEEAEATIVDTKPENEEVKSKNGELENEETETRLPEEKKEEESAVETTEELASPVGDVTLVEEGGGVRSVLMLTILFLLGLMGGLGYLFLFHNSQPSMQSTTDTKLKTIAVYTPVPTQSSVNKSDYTLKVLNGSNTSGVAATTRDFLTEKGYKVGTIGNADTSNYTKTEIQAKDSVSKEFLTNLEKDLGTKYTVDSSTGALDSSATEDVEIIVGSQAAQ